MILAHRTGATYRAVVTKWWPFQRSTSAVPDMITITGYEWCEVCARNVYDDNTHELRHEALARPNRATRRRAVRGGTR